MGRRAGTPKRLGVPVRSRDAPSPNRLGQQVYPATVSRTHQLASLKRQIMPKTLEDVQVLEKILLKLLLPRYDLGYRLLQ